MTRLPLACLFALGCIATPLAWGQTPVNEGPGARPVPVTPDDAEHAPTRRMTPPDDAVARPDAAKRDTPKPGSASPDAAKPGAVVKNPPRRTKDDAEHAPTQKTDGDAPAAAGTERKEPGR